MPIPFEVELIYSYLEELGLPDECSISYVQNSYVGLGLAQKIDTIAHELLEAIDNTNEDRDDHAEEQENLSLAYTAIADVHYSRLYGRHWEYKTDGELLPEALSERFKTILSVETDFLDMINATDSELILDIIQNADRQKINYLNVQTLARIFAYYYENPHNWAFY